ncbi:MAG: sensor histidine kinase [Vulcanimicrobiota bacterium]
MTTATRAALVGLLLLVAGILSPIPSDPLTSGLLVAAILWAESSSFRLTENYQFSPGAPLLLATAVTPGAGPLVGVVAIVLCSLHHLDRSLAENLGQNLALALAYLLAGPMARMSDLPLPVQALLVALVYLVSRLQLEAWLEVPQQAEERAVWRQLFLQIRPLELGLSLLGVALAMLASVYPWALLAVAPLLRQLDLAAENVLGKAKDKTFAQALVRIRQLGDREKAARRALSRVKQEKSLLENFARHLSSHPTPLEAAGQLAATTRELLPVKNVAVFLGEPPEPVSYLVEEALGPRLQARSLLAVTEPAVTEARASGKAVVRLEEPDDKRLFPTDAAVAALPLGELGVLYVGNDEVLSQTQLDQLRWLCQKATLALGSALETHRQVQAKRQAEQAVLNLEKRVEHLSALISGAEAVASSLDPDTLLERFLKVVNETIPNRGGAFFSPRGRQREWGQVPEVSPAGLAQAAEKRQAFELPGPVLLAPLTTGSSCLGVTALVGPAPFSDEQKDQLFILCCQAAMALSNATHYQESVQAKLELERSQAHLVQSSKMTAVGQLSAGVAHELNSPIGAISICLDEALEMFDSHPELVQRLLRRGQEAVERSREIISRLMVYSRPESRTMTPLDLNGLARDTVDFLSYQLKTARVSLSQDLSPDPVMVRGEYQALQQVLTNLLLNAAQAMEEMPEGARPLTLGVRAGKEVELWVTDGGPGIAPDQLERIFEPFFTTKEPGRGTGLGLWSAHQIVERHHGRLEVESQPGQGATFRVILPPV